MRTAEGEEIRADLVVDAMGRRPLSASWLGALGARGPHTCYGNQVAADRIRIAEMTAAAEGGEPPTGDLTMIRPGAAAMHDPEVTPCSRPCSARRCRRRS